MIAAPTDEDRHIKDEESEAQRLKKEETRIQNYVVFPKEAHFH